MRSGLILGLMEVLAAPTGPLPTPAAPPPPPSFPGQSTLLPKASSEPPAWTTLDLPRQPPPRQMT